MHKLEWCNEINYLQITGKDTMTIIPFMLHSLSMSVFSSVIGPFGGFFASGFKRAFKIKVVDTFFWMKLLNAMLFKYIFICQDFGDIIPGHGGIMDRFDCQYLMATFVNVYISSFILVDSPQKLLTQVNNFNCRMRIVLAMKLFIYLFACLF